MTTYIKTFSLATDTMTQQISQKGLTVAQYNQGDVNTDTLNLTVTHNNTVMDLTGATISVVFSKPDGKVVYQDTSSGVTITNAAQGQLAISLNTQTRAAAGTVIGAVRITYPGNQTLETEKFSFNVEASLASDQAIASNNSIFQLQSIIQFKSFTATANQTLFDISDVGSYTTGQNRLFIDVGGVPQSPNNYTETSTTQFTLSEPVTAGTIVNARWFSGGNMYLGGHNTTHEIGGGDVIDVTKLQNYNYINVPATSTGQGVRWDEFSARHNNNGTVKQQMYNKSGTANPSATVNTYGASSVNTPPANFTSIMTMGVNLVFGGTFANGETVTVQKTVTYSDGTTASITKTSTATGTVSLTTTDFFNIVKDGLYITQTSYQSQSSVANSAVTVTVNRYGMYL